MDLYQLYSLFSFLIIGMLYSSAGKLNLGGREGKKNKSVDNEHLGGYDGPSTLHNL